MIFVRLGLVLLSVVVSPAFARAVPLAPDVVPLAVGGPAGGTPTALASADLDADGMPDLIVAYATAGSTTLVVHPGDAEAVYPTPGGTRSSMTAPLGPPRELARVAGRVTALLTVDVDADGLKDVIAERALAAASFLLGAGDGTVVAEEIPVDAARLAALRGRAATLAPHLETVAPQPLAAPPDVFHMMGPDGDVIGYRPSAEAKRALAHPSKPAVLTAPADALAVLPMRLNRDAVADLVVLRPGLPAPEVLFSRAAVTFVVTTTKDEAGACDDVCSLREAIIAANATPDPDVIEFAIPASDPGFQPGTGSWLIQPKGDEYPVITQPVTIDGRTQPGFVDRPVIELNGGALDEDRVGLLIAASNSVVRGLVVSDWPAFRENGEQFCGCAIDIGGGNNCIIEGNYVGTDATGSQARPNGQSGITVSFGQNNLIGGTTPQARNVISGNRIQFFFHVGMGTFVTTSAGNNTFAGNYVGLDASGFNALPNQIGVLINSPNNTVGGTDPGSGNVVAGNTSDLVSIFEASASADGNDVLRNLIGTNAAGFGSFDEGFGNSVRSFDADNTVIGSPGNGNVIAGADTGIRFDVEKFRSTVGHVVQGNSIGVDALGRPAGNGGAGITLRNVFNGTIGGTGNGEGNVIANNASSGVHVLFFNCQSCTSGTLRGNQNRILSNRIFNNSSRGIDLSNTGVADGVTANDAGDGDTGANDLLNWPVLTSASSAAMTSTVNAQALTMGPQSGQPYRLEFFANPTCDTLNGNGEGRIFLGAADRSADGNAISVNLGAPIPNGYFVTATATDAIGNTSEFSNCVQASGGPVAVATATPTPVPTATPVLTPLFGQVPTVAPTNVPGENTACSDCCNDCRDSDGDTLVDRDDPDCPPRTFGFGRGVVDKARAKAASKCEATAAKEGASLVLKELKMLRGCFQKMLACVELKPGDGACIEKAAGDCQKIPDAFELLEDKLEAKLEKACGEPPVAGTDLVNPAGLGYLGERATCQASPFFVFGLDEANDVARCVHARHRCQAAQLASQENPRARELLQLAGVSIFSVSNCLLNPGANGGGQGVSDRGAAKLLVKCAAGIQKGVGKFASTRLSAFRKCAAAASKCIQGKPGDIACLTGARGKCLAAAAKAGTAAKSAGDKARGAILKACAGVEAELVATTGLGQTATATYCAAVGVPAVATAADVADCLIKHHTCRVGQLQDVETPRLREYLHLLGVVP